MDGVKIMKRGIIIMWHKFATWDSNQSFAKIYFK